MDNLYFRGNKPQSEQTATPDKYPQGKFKDKECRLCKTVFSPKAPSHLYCSDECAHKSLIDRVLIKQYGITLDTYNELYEKQDGLCAICKEEGFVLDPNQKIKIVIDHCHVTGKVRGLLCHNCNRALGLLKDKVERLKEAIRYLEENA